jgi:DNA primase
VQKYFQRIYTKEQAREAVAARKYLESRGYSLEDAKKYRLGWAPESGRNLSVKLRDQKMEN